MIDMAIGSMSVDASTFSRSSPVLATDHRRMLIGDRPIAWREKAIDRLRYLCALRRGWDGYLAQPVRPSTASFALLLLESICSPDSPTPSIVPGVAGDLQIEWHLARGDIELHVIAPNHVEASFEEVSGHEDERSLTVDFRTVSEWLMIIAEGHGAAVAAAA